MEGEEPALMDGPEPPGSAPRALLALDVPVLPTLSEAEVARDRFSDRQSSGSGLLRLRIDARPRVGDTLVVSGWPIASEGRKDNAGTAIKMSRTPYRRFRSDLNCADSLAPGSMGVEVARIGYKPAHQKGSEHQHSGGKKQIGEVIAGARI